MPHFDSIRMIPEDVAVNDSVKKNLIKAFQNMGNIQLPHKTFQIGDTASLTVTIPLGLPIVNETNFETSIYKLTKIENGIAYFDVSVTMKFNGLANDVNISGKCSSSGKCIYDRKSNYFKSIGIDMDFNVPVSINTDNHHIEVEMLGNRGNVFNFSCLPNN